MEPTNVARPGGAGAEGVPVVHVLPSFHYDVAYLRPAREYFPLCFRILDEALRILAAAPEYRFVVEQVILLAAYWEQAPAATRESLRRFAAAGRLEVAPGLWVMPDLNHTDGESLFRQARLGRAWLREHLGVEPRVCWIADCWGHHAQLPQILTQAGYAYYVFWRCMRRDVLVADFHWQGLDGTALPTHWLARGYGNVRFPTDEALVNAPDLNVAGCGPEAVRTLCGTLSAYAPGRPVLLCNGGDFMVPQATAPEVVRRLNAGGDLPPVRFSTASDYLDALDWTGAPRVAGEFNSAFQGTFTSNVRIKQANRVLPNRLLALESLAVALGRPHDPDPLWKPLLKQQFHDIICGTICDEALRDWEADVREATAALDLVAADLAEPGGEPAVFNPTAWERREVVDAPDGRRVLVTVPPLGFARLAAGREVRPDAAVAGGGLPGLFRNAFYRVEIDAQGYLTCLVEAATGADLVGRPRGVTFGMLGMQLDYGDLWLNFESPLNGGSVESSLTQNHPDPWDRSRPGDLVNRGTFRPRVTVARVLGRSADGLEVEQEGVVGFWQLQVRFRTRIRFSAHSPRIEYRTSIQPGGRHYRLRVAFPTAVREGAATYEIPFGIQARGPGEHVALNWVAVADAEKGLAVLNRGTPGAAVEDGVVVVTLFRSAGMEYKAPSALSFNDGVPHEFEYAVLACRAERMEDVVRAGQEFNRPLVPTAVVPERCGAAGWGVAPDHVLISALRWQGREVFVRVYEAAGRAAEGSLRVPARFREWAAADGVGQAQTEFRPCAGAVPLRLRPFEVRAVLLRA